MDKIVCVGKNYSEHIKEMGGKTGDMPVVFLKPPSVLRRAAAEEELALRLPTEEGEIHHECEIVLEMKANATQVSVAEAGSLIGGVTLGLDLTKRDLQAKQKAAGQPWTTSKVFADSAVIGPVLSLTTFARWQETEFRFFLDDQLKQQGTVAQMSLSPAECVAFISRLFPLCAGDLIFTGTPRYFGLG